MPLSPQQLHATGWAEVRYVRAVAPSDPTPLAGVIASIITARDGCAVADAATSSAQA